MNVSILFDAGKNFLFVTFKYHPVLVLSMVAVVLSAAPSVDTYTRTLADTRSILIVKGEFVAATGVLCRVKSAAAIDNPVPVVGSKPPFAFVITNPPDLATPVVTSADAIVITSFTSVYVLLSATVRPKLPGFAIINTDLAVLGTLYALERLGMLFTSSVVKSTIFTTLLAGKCPSKKTA